MVAQRYWWDQFQTNRIAEKSKKPVSNEENQRLISQEPSPQQEEKTGFTQNEASPSEFSWGQFQTPSSYYDAQQNEPQETVLETGARNLVSNTFRVAEQYGGRYGNLIEFAKNTLANFPQSAGLLGSALSEYMGPEKWKEAVLGGPDKSLGGVPFPTSEQLKGVTELATGEYTKPKGKVEKGIQEFTSDVGAALNLRPTSTGNALVNQVGIPAAANVVKQTIEHLGFGEDKANYAKFGAWTAFSLLNNVNGRAYASQQVNQAREALPNHLNADLNNYIQRIDNLDRRFLHNDPRSQLAAQQLQGIRQDIQNGQTGIHNLLNRYDAINATKQSRGLFELARGPQREAARRNIDQVLHTVRDQIMEAGAQYPEALQQWRNGIQSLAVIHQSNRMTNAASRFLTGPWGKLVASPVAALFGVTGFYNPKATIATAATAGALYKSWQVAHRVWNDPRLARYYWQAISGLAEENANIFVKNFNDLDKIYKQKEKKKKGSFAAPVKAEAK